MYTYSQLRFILFKLMQLSLQGEYTCISGSIRIISHSKCFFDGGKKCTDFVRWRAKTDANNFFQN